ncbi:LITAF-like zinc ribbon domain-containing protein [Ditylenchus destructor]|uniref:LITAF-like zinc ribbon domain-containing protein n=1 Tax=Ditylenchus destructor TaxID=166010 RepID=A0AAD4N3Z6_9BILA|nr:LITAF-like zinc ribbon domain-containing protein [Ditylenchus destructor]
MASTSKRVSFNEKVVSHGPAPYPSVAGMAPHSMRVKCPKCRQQVDTLANKHPGLVAFFSGALLFIFGCVCCAWIPCVMESCQDVKHTCPNCESYLGHYTAYLD